MRIDLVTLLVLDQDEAISFFVEALGFVLTEDRASVGSDGRSKRWVVVRPPEGGTGLLLTLPHGAKQLSQVGRQADGRVAWFLQVEEFAPVHARMVEAGVEFLEAPRHEEYGTVAVFRDCSGNRWDLLGA